MREVNFEASSDFPKWLKETAVDFGKELAASFEPCYERKTAEDHSRDILDSADKALSDGDRDEAAHQLSRQLKFSKHTDFFSSRYDQAAKAGLKALEEGKTNSEVAWQIDRAFLRLGECSLHGSQIPVNPRANYLVRRTRYIAEAMDNCERILGDCVPFDLEDGNSKEFIEDYLRRTIYLSKRYIPGEDKYEVAAKRALAYFEEGNMKDIWDVVRPFKERYEERNYYLKYLQNRFSVPENR